MIGTILVVVDIVLLVCILLFSLSLIFFFINSLFTDAPFVPVKKNVMEQIIKALELKSGSVLYDLGCGDSRVLAYAINSKKDIKAIGIEKNLIVYLWSKWCSRKTKVEIYLKDFSKVNLKDATHIYMYLFPKIIENLLSKFEKECAKGTRIVSCDFFFKDVLPDEVIDLPERKDGLCKKLYVYVLK